MTGYSEVYGAYMTKEDKKNDLIAKARKLNAAMNEYDDPTFHAYQSYFSEYLRIESILINKYGMNENEIFIAIN